MKKARNASQRKRGTEFVEKMMQDEGLTRDGAAFGCARVLAKDYGWALQGTKVCCPT